MISHGVRHFAPIARTWGEARRRHRGPILVTVPHTDYGAILRRLEQLLAERADQAEWADRVEFLGRG